MLQPPARDPRRDHQREHRRRTARRDLGPRSVAANGVDYGHVAAADCASEDGWHYTDPTPTAIELCGAACDDLRLTGAVDVDYSCPE